MNKQLDDVTWRNAVGLCDDFFNVKVVGNQWIIFGECVYHVHFTQVNDARGAIDCKCMENADEMKKAI